MKKLKCGSIVVLRSEKYLRSEGDDPWVMVNERGRIVEVHASDTFEVEFTGGRRLTLNEDEIHPFVRTTMTNDPMGLRTGRRKLMLLAMLSAFFLGAFSTAAFYSAVQDYLGLDRYVAYLYENWVQMHFSVSVGLFLLFVGAFAWITSKLVLRP